MDLSTTPAAKSTVDSNAASIQSQDRLDKPSVPLELREIPATDRMLPLASHSPVLNGMHLSECPWHCDDFIASASSIGSSSPIHPQFDLGDEPPQDVVYRL